MLFWILFGFEIAILALASLNDCIWKERMNPPQQHPIVCPFCTQGNPAVEVLGHLVHRFQDRWVSCPAKSQPQTDVAKVKSGVTAPLTGEGALQSDELLPAAE